MAIYSFSIPNHHPRGWRCSIPQSRDRRVALDLEGEVNADARWRLETLAHAGSAVQLRAVEDTRLGREVVGRSTQPHSLGTPVTAAARTVLAHCAIAELVRDGNVLDARRARAQWRLRLECCDRSLHIDVNG